MVLLPPSPVLPNYEALSPGDADRPKLRAFRISLEGAVLAACLLLFVELLLHGSEAVASWSRIGNAHGPLQQILAQAAQRALSGDSASPDASPASIASVTHICPGCNFSRPGDFASSLSFSAIPVLDREAARSVFQMQGQQSGGALVKRFLVQHIPLAATLSKAWMSTVQQNVMLNTYLTAPDQLLSYSFDGLRLDRPTTYVYTRTRGGKPYTATQLAYFQAHHDTIIQHMETVQREGYMDGTRADERQLLYIVVRDDNRLDPRVQSFFRQSKIPYLYFAVGPTKKNGIVQWNAVERAIEVLRDSFFGNGPVLNIDDDARILPDVLDRIWGVNRLIVWPVGNLNPGGWEGLMCEDGKPNHWRLGWNSSRIFPLDMQGFAINSSEIGVGRPISGPKYIPFAEKAPETYFLEQLSQERNDAECLCDNTQAQGCFYAWHNWKLKGENAEPLSREEYLRLRPS